MSLMHKVNVQVTWRQNEDGNGYRMEFRVNPGSGEPFKDTPKLYMVGAGSYKQRVPKDNYLKLNPDYGESPGWQTFFIWAKTQDLTEAKRIAKKGVQERYLRMREDVLKACEVIDAYDPEAADA